MTVELKMPYGKIFRYKGCIFKVVKSEEGFESGDCGDCDFHEDRSGLCEEDSRFTCSGLCPRYFCEFIQVFEGDSHYA